MGQKIKECLWKKDNNALSSKLNLSMKKRN